MKITEELVEAMGFEKIENSVNPTYYIYRIRKNRFKYDDPPFYNVIIAVESTSWGERWSLQKDQGDNAEFVCNIENLQQLVGHMMDHGVKAGKLHQQQLVRESIGLSITAM